VYEWQAFDSGEDRAEQYLRAGADYLMEESDPQSALRCYGQALDAGGQTSLAVRPDDDWLLMAIKDARKKEKLDANMVD
jgi:hypothetical protein